MSREPALVPDGFFVLRTPLYPVAELLAIGEGLAAPAHVDEAALERRVADDTALVRARLCERFARPELAEALYVASPSLHAAVAGGEPAKVERALYKYFARSCTRPTPFGLFAGCTVGTLGGATDLRITPRSEYRKHTRLDMAYLCALVRDLLRDPDIRRSTCYRPTSSLHARGDVLHYVEALGEARRYALAQASRTPYLDRVLARATSGATVCELVQELVAGGDVTDAEASEFIESVIDAQLLVPELEPVLTGDEPHRELVAQLRAMPADATLARRAASTLDAVGERLAAIDRTSVGLDVSHHRDIQRQLESLPTAPDPARLFQVDLFKSGHATLGTAVLDEITRGVGLVQRLGSGQSEQLARFREAFVRRYEDRWVPLLEALDEDRGIGFGMSRTPTAEVAPLLEGIAFRAPVEDSVTVKNARRHRHLTRRLEELHRSGCHEWRLDAADWEILTEPAAELPVSLFAKASVSARSAEALARDEFRVHLQVVAGPSAANLLGRFCHGDPRLLDLVRRHVRAEEESDPDTIYAEIVHLHEPHTANLLLRPLLRQHEIAFLGRSGALREDQIALSDLWVTVHGDEIIVRSERLGRRVVPRLATAHNYWTQGLAPYRFLCLLQGQGVFAGGGFRWGAHDTRAFLPRVTDGKLILSRARWQLGREELVPLRSGAAAARYRAAFELREARGLPRFVVVEDGDNELWIDLENPVALDTFVHLTKDRDVVRLTEPSCPPDALCVRGPEGMFAHEVIVPFIHRARTAARTPSPPLRTTAAPRSFAPGSEWLYAKLYGPASAADDLLVGTVAPLVARLRDRGTIDRWFFLRYQDPDGHLRVRLHGEPARLLSEALPLLTEAVEVLRRRELLYRLELATYEREVRRYGGDEAIPFVEELFEADSDAVAAVVGLLDGIAGDDARWRLALRGCDRILVDLGLAIADRLALAERMRDAFAREHRVDTIIQRQLGDRFRRERRQLDAILDDSPGDALAWLQPGCDAIDRRSARNRRPVAALSELARRGALDGSLVRIAESLLHMHCNRMCRGEARAQELVLYDFLARLYRSMLARRDRGAA